MKLTKKIAVCAVTAALAASFGLAGCSSDDSDSSSSTDTAATEAQYTVNIGHLNSTAHVLAFVAQEEGFFAEEGINATLTQFDTSADLVSGLESGKLDVSLIGSVPTLVNISSGHDLSIFGGAMTNGHGVVIKSQYTEGQDSWDVSILKGRTVAVPTNTVQQLETYEAITDAGLTYSEEDDAIANGYDVQIKVFESQKDAYNALSNDEIDAATTYSPYTSIAVDDGYSVVFKCSDLEHFENQPCCRQVATTEALNANPEKYEAFERAIIKAYQFYKENQDQTVTDVKKYIDIEDSEIKDELYDEEYCDSNPDPDLDATADLKADALSFGYIETDFDLEEHYNLDIYQNALNSLAEEDSSNEVYAQLQEHFKQFR